MASAEVQAVLSNPANFEALVAQLLVADNEARKHAELVFEGLKQHPDACVQLLLRSLRQSPAVENRSFCAIMLRKVLCHAEPNLYTTSSPQVQAAAKAELMNALREETQRTVVKKVGDTMSELGGDLLDRNAWPELLPALMDMVSGGAPAPAEAALNILATLAAYNTDVLRPLLPSLQPLLGACLGAQNLDVQVAALRCSAGFVTSLEDAKERDVLQALLPAMLAALGRCLQGGDEPAAQEVLELMIEIGDTHPRFLKRHLVDVVAAMLQITTAAQLEASTRSLAAEFLVTLAEARDKAPGMVRKLPHFVAQLFEALMGFLLDVEDDPLWHNADSDQYEEEGAGELYDGGQEFLDRLAIAIGGKALVPAAGQLLPAWLRDADWRKRQAALICLAQIAEGCSKVMAEQLEPLVGMCVQGLQDPHPKVRWAACQAVGQMCTDLGPGLQEKCHAQILPALMAGMDDFANPRVQAHAAAAIVNFSENTEPELLAPYLDVLITKLLVLLQQGKKLVQEGALTAMASVADCSQEQFVRYYDAVMPLLSSILLNAGGREHRMLRAKALECVSLVGMAVGRARFRQDAGAVMNYLQQLHAAELEADDPTSSYMLQAGARLCKALGQEFIPYLGVVMPPLLKSATLEPDVRVRGTDDDEDDEDDDDDDVEHVQLGDKVLAIRTSVLEEKATACNMLCCYADELKEGFFPFVKQVVDIMVPLLKFYFHEEVRRAAVSALPHLLRSAQVASERGVPGATTEFVNSMVSFMWEPLMTAMQKEPDMDVQASMLDATSELIELLEASQLSQPQVQAVFTTLDDAMKRAGQRRAHRAKRTAGEDFDDEEAEALEAENEAEEELYDQVCAVIGSLLKRFGDAVLPFVEGLMPHIAPLLDRARPDEERRIALCVIDDLLDHSPAGRAKYLPQVLPVLLDACLATHADLRQCAVYGVAVAAAKSPEQLKPQAAPALQRVLAILSHPEARSEENEMATDNAISALAALMVHHADVLDGAAMADAWVGALPVSADTVEAHKMHELLVQRCEAQDPLVLGAGNKNAPKILACLVQVLGRGSDLVAADVVPRAVALVHHLQPLVAAGTVEAAFAGLSEKQKAAFQRCMAGGAPE